MQDKVYVIEEGPQPPGGKRARGGPIGSDPVKDSPPSSGKERNPAIAFSLSVFFWGGGQFYNRQGKLGALLLLLMANFYAYLVVSVLYWDFVRGLFARIYLSPSQSFLVLWVSFVLGVIVWIAGSRQAYAQAADMRSSPFGGVESRFLPALCSLLYPGWGQFLNGQPRKGLFFLLFAAVGFSALGSILVIPLLWESFEPSASRALLDWIFALSCLVLPLPVLLWTIAFFDALKVGLDEVKKEPWFDRMGFFRNQLRVRGWKRLVLPHLMRTLISLGVLAVLLGVAYFFTPRDFYVSVLRNSHASLAGKGMTVAPLLLEGALEGLEEKRGTKNGGQEP